MAADEITQLLISARRGEKGVLDALFSAVYDELHRVAHRARSMHRPDESLNTTALVHEVFLKLHSAERLSAEDRRHFFGIAAMAMRQILVDRARRRMAEKRGGGMKRVDLEETIVPVDDCAAQILMLEDALRHLSALDPRLGKIVDLRFFAGLTIEETAEVLELDPTTVKRDWRKARAILHLALSEGAPS